MTVWYNEIDPYAAAWLRNLIAAGHIADGVVDERSVVDNEHGELDRSTQCHFFAGIGVWSHALRLAGWPDDRPVWTGSCPCQPFSAAGKREGDQDERHLWPAWHRLIRECRPATVFGEQVAGGDGLAWLDLVLPDLEDDHYAVAAANLCAAGVGAPHIRQRLFFVAHAHNDRRASKRHARRPGLECDSQPRGATCDCGLGDAAIARSQGCDESGERSDAQRAAVERTGAARKLGDATGDGQQQVPENAGRRGIGSSAERLAERPLHKCPRGHWDACDWIPCRDGKARPVEPGTFPLAHGAPARVGRLRAYGNAIVAPLAAAFVKAAST